MESGYYRGVALIFSVDQIKKSHVVNTRLKRKQITKTVGGT
ncbi:hypothetical protein EDC32_101485 [Laceyella sacchari]|nr:hypothetical protein EDC32_101485 [Laceyella sacchari]